MVETLWKRRRSDVKLNKFAWKLDRNDEQHHYDHTGGGLCWRFVMLDRHTKLMESQKKNLNQSCPNLDLVGIEIGPMIDKVVVLLTVHLAGKRPPRVPSTGIHPSGQRAGADHPVQDGLPSAAQDVGAPTRFLNTTRETLVLEILHWRTFCDPKTSIEPCIPHSALLLGQPSRLKALLQNICDFYLSLESKSLRNRISRVMREGCPSLMVESS